MRWYFGYVAWLARRLAYRWRAWRWTPHPSRYMDRGVSLYDWSRHRLGRDPKTFWELEHGQPDPVRQHPEAR